MGAKLSFLTLQREDLFDISHVLADAIVSADMSDAQNPYVVSVRGSTASGKKIISDGMRRILLSSSSPIKYQGTKGFDEYWKGETVDKRDVEFDFIDAGWRHWYSNMYHVDALQPKRPIHESEEFLRIFFNERSRGGLSVIQNNQETPNSGLDLWIEKQMHRMPLGGNIDSRLTADNPMRGAFNCASSKKDNNAWIRYVEIDVKDTRLLDLEKMRSALERLQASAEEVIKALTRYTAVPERPYKDEVIAAKLDKSDYGDGGLTPRPGAATVLRRVLGMGHE